MGIHTTIRFILFGQKNKTPRVKYYLENSEGIPTQELWTDISNIQSSKERIGYPTQKPEKLLGRITLASSNEGDVVLDCFMGGGSTTVAVADRLGRQWIGIDQSVQAIKVSEFRLNRQQNLFSQPFEVKLHKYDYDKLFNMNPFDFESFIVQQIGGTANKKQRGDGGIDGKMSDGTPIQVKQQENIAGPKLRQFFYDAEAFDRKLFEEKVKNGETCGTIIAFSFGKGAVEEVAKIKNEKGCIFRLVKVNEIVPIAKKPKLIIKITDLEKTRKGHLLKCEAMIESDKEIEFLAWDFDYAKDLEKIFNPEILFEKNFALEQEIPIGEHQITCKIVDIDGIEALEVVKVKVNGGVSVE